MKDEIKENKICHDELLSQLFENCNNVETLALSEINNLELVFPIFASIGTLNKYEFNTLLKRIKKMKGNPQHQATLIIFCLDSLTCMIKNSSLYKPFMFNNKVNLILLNELLGIIYMTISNSPCIFSKSLSSLIAILERSAARIRFQERAFFDELVTHIERFKIIEKVFLDNKLKTQLRDDFYVTMNTKVADLSKCNFRKVAPVAEVNSDQNSLKHQNNCHSTDISIYDDNNDTKYKKVDNEKSAKKDCNVKEPFKQPAPAKQSKITNFGCNLMKKNKEKQLPSLKRSMDDTDFVNKKENIQPPIKKIKLETAKYNLLPCYVQMKKINAFEFMMSQSLLKKK